MAALDTQNTRHANRCRVVVNGETLAEGQDVTVQEAGGTQGIYTIGDVYPKEHVHNQYSVQVTIGTLYWKENALELFSPNERGGELVQLPTFDIEAYDESDGSTLFVVRDCTLTNRSISIRANQPVVRNVSILGIRVDAGAGGIGGGTPTTGPV